MDSIEPPSFSLGFDLLDAASSDSHHNIPNEPELGLTISDSDQELEFSSPVLKRLRRGVKIDDRGLVANESLVDPKEDDIEEFSSPEKLPSNGPASTRSHFASCSSKFPLHGSGVLSNQPSSSVSRGKRKHLDDVPVSAGSGVTSVSSLFQRSTRSPLRMFQLLDSDSEDDHPSTSRDLSGDASKQKRKESGDLWKDFSPAFSKIQTPALDEICQDYFSSIKTSGTAQRRSCDFASSSNSSRFDNLTGFKQTGQCVDISQPSLPSHRFFLHNDPRIRSLARQRLPNFLPLGIVNDTESRQEASLVDYMNQFGSKGSSKTGGSSCRKGQTKSKVSKSQESALTSEGWSNPKARSGAPKDAGKRRVSAANNAPAGHWFTSPEGKKVYISKSGQEFSGQSAYRCYKKESGGGFKKNQKKRQPKKKAKK